MFGEPFWKTLERRKRMALEHIELANSTPDEVMFRDQINLQGGTEPVSMFSQAAMRLARHAAEEIERKKREQEENRTRAADPYGPEAMALPGVENGDYDESKFRPRAQQQSGLLPQAAQYGEDESLLARPPTDTSVDALGYVADRINRPIAEDLAEKPVIGGAVQRALDVPVVGQALKEVTRPTNWMAAAAPGLSFASKSGYGVRLAAETAGAVAGMEASEQTYEHTGALPDPVRTGLAVGAGIVTGGLAGGGTGMAATRLRPKDAFELFSGLEPEALKPALRVSDMKPDPRPFAAITGGADDAVKLAPTDPNSATQRLFAMQPVKPGLSRSDRLMNSMKETLGVGVPEEDIATPIMRERKRVQSVVDSQATRLGAVAENTTKVFKMDKRGRIESLPGSPTIQDLAARRPQYERLLTPPQREALQRLQAEVMPYADSLAELGIDVNRRADVMEGGFYLPRGRADIEGADVPIKVGSGRGNRGKAGFEKHAEFDSMTEGIEAGYEYAPLHEALESYGREAGTRALDKWAAEQFRATGLGETVAERTNPELRIKVQTLRSKIASKRPTLIRQEVRATERDAAARQAEQTLDDLIAAADDELQGWNREIGRQDGRAERASERGASAFLKAEKTGAEYDRLREELRDIADEWKRVQEKAAQTPRDQGAIGFSALNGTTFPDAVANVANKYLNAEKSATGRGTVVLKTVDAVNTLLRGLSATADVSFMAIQGSLGAVSHPVAYSRALLVALRSMVDPDALGAHLIHFDAAAKVHQAPDSRAWASSGLRIGSSNTEFQVGRGIGGKVGSGIRNAPGAKQSNRAFGVFGDVLRLEVANAIYDGQRVAAKSLTPPELQDIARGSNLLTGWSENTLGDAGPLLLFAPRFFRSQLDLVGHALTSGIVEGTERSATGDEARRALIRLMGIGTAITVGANEALGGETDFDPRSPNFMRIRNVGGQDVSLFGPWDSLMRAMVNTTTDRDPSYLLRTKASPTVALAWDLIEGETFAGEDPQSPDAILRRLLPFSLQDVPEAATAAFDKAREGDFEGAAGELAPIGVGMTGLKSTPLTPTEQLDSIAQDSPEGKDFYDLEPHRRDELLKANPELAKKQLERGSDERQAAEKVRAELRVQQEADDTAFRERNMDIQEWKDARNDRRNQLDGALGQIYLDSPDREPDPNKPWEVYGKVIADHTVNGKVDWDAVDEWRAQNDSRPYEGERTWGDAIDDNSGYKGTDLEKEYRAVGKQLDKLGFFEMREQAWEDLKARHPDKLGDLGTYEEWHTAELKEITQQMLDLGVPAQTARAEAEDKLAAYKTVTAFSEFFRTEYRHAFVVENKDLALEAVKFGYFDPDKAEKKFLRSTP